MERVNKKARKLNKRINNGLVYLVSPLINTDQIQIKWKRRKRHFDLRKVASGVAMHLCSRGRELDIRSGCGCVTNDSGQVVHVPLSSSSMIWYRGKSRRGNGRSRKRCGLPSITPGASPLPALALKTSETEMSTAPWRRTVQVCTAAMLTSVLLFLSDTARIGRGAESM